MTKSLKVAWITASLGFAVALVASTRLWRIEEGRLTVLRAKARFRAGQTVSAIDFTPILIYGDKSQIRALFVTPQELEVFRNVPLGGTIEAGELLLQNAFSFDGRRGLRDAIDPHHRAVALRVREGTNIVGSFVRVGDIVDVWAQNNDRMSIVISNVKVLAIDGPRESPSALCCSVTVIVPERDLEAILTKLEKSESNGIMLALRGTTP